MVSIWKLSIVHLCKLSDVWLLFIVFDEGNYLISFAKVEFLNHVFPFA